MLVALMVSGVAAHGGLLGLGDVVLRAVGERENQRDADDADRPGKGREEGPPLLGHEVGEREAERLAKAHRALALARVGHGVGLHLLRREALARGVDRCGVARDEAVLDAHDAVGVALGQLGVVRDHDHQAVARELLQDLHDLHGGIGVERAGGFVGEDDLGVVDDGTGDGDALHLSARELVGFLFEVVAQAHAAQRLLRTAVALGGGRAREHERHLHVGDHRLVRDEVVALKDEAHAVVAVGVPVAVEVAFGRAAVDDEIALGVLVEPADDVEERGLAAAGLTEDAHELAAAEGDRDALERVDDGVAGGIVLGDAFEFEHGSAFLCTAGGTASVTRPVESDVHHGTHF